MSERVQGVAAAFHEYPVRRHPESDILSRYKLPTITICAGVMMAIVAFILMLDISMRQLERNFIGDANMHMGIVEDRLFVSLSDLDNLSQLLAAGHSNVREEFHIVADALVRRNAFQGVYWVGTPDAAQLLPRETSAWDGYVPPLSGQPAVLEDVRRAIRTGVPVVSDALAMPPPHSSEIWVAFVYPLAPGKGAVVALLNLNTMLDQGADASHAGNAEIYVFSSAGGQEKLLYGHGNEFVRTAQLMQRNLNAQSVRDSSGFFYASVLSLFDRQWQVILVPTSQYMSRASSMAPWIVMAACLTLTSLMGAFLFQLIGQNTRIEQVVEDRTAALLKAGQQLEAAKEAAEAASKTKSDFLANMSHEIRTPLNSMIALTELLIDTELGTAQKNYLQMVLHSSENLLSIINDILDISKIESGKLELAPVSFDLHAAVWDTAQLFEVRARAQQPPLELQIAIAPDVPRYIVADPLRVKQILSNLVSNAVKFTDRGYVRIEVVVIQDTDLPAAQIRLKFSVEDTGIGIPPDKLQLIFEKFSQADFSTTRKYGGTGLGLAICRQLATMMQGEIQAESRWGEGSTFSVDLVIKQGEGKEKGTAMQSSNENVNNDETYLAGARVLLVEDNRANREVATILLEDLGCVVQTARNGEEALESVRGQPCDLILMDCHMPEMDGFEASTQLREMKQRGEIGDIPVIALTANAMKGDRERCLQAGMNDYIAKPLRRVQLAAMLRQWLPPADRRVA